jgi:hypothetical protein
MMADAPSRIDMLELDIDIRLADLWREVSKINKWTLDVAAPFIRAAYGKGYSDVFRESEDERGKLCLDHGYKLPTPHPTTP